MPMTITEQRTDARRRFLKSAKIVLSDNAPKIECTVRNISEHGALLEVSATYGIPHRFELLLGNERKTCHVVWVKDSRLGVTFV
jgi:hypothetical protein